MNNQNEEEHDCCSSKAQDSEKKSFWHGIAYGLIPHIGCIGFIVASVIGVTVAMNIFRPLLMNRYIFHILILISFMFATVSSIIYLKKNGLLSLAGVKRKRKYLVWMFGSTIGINLLLFLFVFPLFANVSSPSVTGAVVGVGALSSINMEVDIPCPGHAPLISNELQTIDGVGGIQYSFPNKFEVEYDPLKTSKAEMLDLEVFDEYPAILLDKDGNPIENQPTKVKPVSTSTSGGGCSGGCGGSGSCGGSCGSSSCRWNQ